MLRNYVKPNERGVKEQKYGFKRGTTPWTKEKIWDLVVKDGEHIEATDIKFLQEKAKRLSSLSDVLDLGGGEIQTGEQRPAETMDTS